MKSEKRFPHLITILTLIGVALYLGRSLYFAHTSLSIGDEGGYLYKGLLYARGDYALFQDYGLWTNKAPLAFLIPGYIQLWFGPGLREGRYFAVFVSMLMLVGLWISANRLGGKKWAAVAVWVCALSVGQVATYSLALSQGLVACLLSWVMVCVVGEHRKQWQLVLGGVLAALMVMTRQNMVFFLPILFWYIFWEYGKRAGLWAMISSLCVFLIFHALYWPNILQLWVQWLPRSLTPFLDQYRLFAITGADIFSISLMSRVQALAIGMRDHFFILCGNAMALILFPPRRSWKDQHRFKTAIFLGITFLVLFAMHAWASLFNNYCVQCFTSYQMFYTVVGMLFVVIVFSNNMQESLVRRVFCMLVLLIFTASVGLSYFQDIGTWALDTISVPLINRIVIQGEMPWVSMGDILAQRWGLGLDLQKRVAASLVGFLIGLLLLGVVRLAHRFYFRKGLSNGISVSQVVITAFLTAGVVIPPAVYAGVYSTSCSTRFLSHYEEAGSSLSDVIPSGNLVYWKGSGRHLALLLYVDDIRLFAPQITAGGGYVVSGERDHLLRFGLFDNSIDAEWRKSADVFILWRGYPNLVISDFEEHEEYQPLPFDMHNLAQCEEELFVYSRLP